MKIIEAGRAAFQQELKDIPNQFESTWVPNLYKDIQAEFAELK